MGFTVKKGSEKGSQKGFLVEGGGSRRCLERPLGEYDPLGVHPKLGFGSTPFLMRLQHKDPFPPEDAQSKIQTTSDNNSQQVAYAMILLGWMGAQLCGALPLQGNGCR